METEAMEEVKRIIIAELPELMKVDPDIRNFILNVTRESYPDKRETESRFDRIMDELKRDREARDKKWDAQDKKWEENQRVINEILVSIQKLDKKHDATIGALGARWGLHSESAFRKGLRAILEGSFGVKGYCQEFCVKFFSANFLKNGRVVGTFPMGFDLQWISILRHTKASRVYLRGAVEYQSIRHLIEC
jgi:hypothetical protein